MTPHASLGFFARPRLSRKAALITSTATIMMMAAPSAFAQTNPADGSMIAITDNTPVINPGVGTTIDIAAGVTQTIGNANSDNNANILLDGDGDNDDVTITNNGTLINNDTQDQSGVVTIDNAENNTIITNNGTFQGINGVLFFEGDEVTLTNTGTIAGTGEADTAVVFFDRDGEDGRSNGEVPVVGTTESNTIINTATGTITSVGGATIGIDVLLGIDPSSGTLADEDGITAFTITNAGTISNTGTDGDADAIHFDGAPGTLSGNARTCTEGTQINCQVLLTLTNDGTISATNDSSSNGGIVFENDVIFNGTITNNAGGVITGAANGIRINTAHAAHDGIITNAGTISGTGTSGRGIRLAGEGVEITNSGTISGTSAAVDASDGTAAFTFNQLGGGFLTGDFRGTTGFDDIFNVSAGTFTLTDDILQTVNVNVLNGGTLAFNGGNTIDGNLDVVSGGALNFNLANAPVIVSGNVNLASGSTVNVDDASQVTGLGQSFTLIDVGGTLTNNSTLVPTIANNSFLLNFDATTNADGDLVVTSAAAGSPPPPPPPVSPPPPPPPVSPPPPPPPPTTLLPASITDANEGIFGTALVSAFNAGALDGTSGFGLLTGTEEQVAAAIQENLPDEGNAPTFEVAEIVQDVNNIIGGRLNSLAGKTANFGGGVEQFAQSSTTLTDATNNYGSSNTGAWVQGGYRYARQSGDSNNGNSFNGYTADVVNFAVGYDYALTADTILGISGSFSTASTDERNGNGEADINLFQAILYAAKNYGPINISGQASYSVGDVEAERTTSVETITGEYDVDGFNIEGEASYQFDLDDNGYIAPLVGLRYGNFSSDEFTEDGGFDAIIGGNTTDLFEGRAGFITGNSYELSNAAIDVYAHAAYVYNFGGGVDDLDIIVGGQSASLERFEFDDQRVELGLGANWISDNNFTLGAAIDGEAGSSYTSIGGRLRAKFSF